MSEVGWLQPVMAGQWVWQQGINPLLRTLNGQHLCQVKKPLKYPFNRPKKPSRVKRTRDTVQNCDTRNITVTPAVPESR